ncbi:phage holin family protein [Erwinia sp. 9145]|uniref:phage holin family protein n=1 Tax=Erwinia sp. 9145 TaxID=1500895 RepID=UPI0005589C2E|nr:phage holin family protein [Erwinia sp. 9145]
MVTNDLLMVWANVSICTAIVLRLMLFHKPGARDQKWASWLAYLIILAYATVPFRFFFDTYTHASWSSITFNLIFCGTVYRAKGNVALIFAVLKPDK